MADYKDGFAKIFEAVVEGWAQTARYDSKYAHKTITEMMVEWVELQKKADQSGRFFDQYQADELLKKLFDMTQVLKGWQTA